MPDTAVMGKIKRYIGVGAGVLLLAGCGGGSGQGVTITAQVPVTVTASPSAEDSAVTGSTAVETASPSTAGSTSAAVPLGSSQAYGPVTMTVHGIDRNVPAETSLDDAEKRTAVDIEACAHGPNVKVSGIRWALQDANGGRYTPGGYTINPVLPEYPSDRGVDVLDGECFRGWLVINVPEAAPLTMVRYTPVDENNQPLATLFWSIS